MTVITLNICKKEYEVYNLLRSGETWEVELENSTYIVCKTVLYEGLNIQHSLVNSI